MLTLVVALQGQLMRWLKHCAAEADLLVVDAHAPDMVPRLEAGITGGLDVILQARLAVADEHACTCMVQGSPAEMTNTPSFTQACLCRTLQGPSTPC